MVRRLSYRVRETTLYCISTTSTRFTFFRLNLSSLFVIAVTRITFLTSAYILYLFPRYILVSYRDFINVYWLNALSANTAFNFWLSARLSLWFTLRCALTVTSLIPCILSFLSSKYGKFGSRACANVSDFCYSNSTLKFAFCNFN